MKKNLWNQFIRSTSLKKKVGVTLGLIVIYKFLSIIPVPGVSVDGLESMKNILSQQPGLSFFSSLMGGSLERFSIILMGLSPYINASIIIQLLTVVVPQLEQIKKEGAQGQKKINMYTRYLTIPLAFLQAYGMILLLNNLSPGVTIVDTSNLPALVGMMTIITAGTVFLMWLGEQINEIGIGNGISMVIFAGLLSDVPSRISNQLSGVVWSAPLNTVLLSLLPFVILLLSTAAVIYVIIRFTEGHRRIPLVYTKTGRDERSFFPIRINQTGMIPIIFALSLVTFPYIISQAIVNRGTLPPFINNAATLFSKIFDPNNPSWPFVLIFIALILGFSYFYLSITFDTKEVAENIQKRGGYIPGIRPGRQTSDYLRTVSNHLNFFGGSFIALIAAFPYIATLLNNTLKSHNIPSLSIANIDFLISGSGLLIAVGVVLELLRRFTSELQSHDYKRFY